MEKDANLLKKIWEFDREGIRKGTWWWWFWLFFFDNPENPKKPRQLMILWSTKNEEGPINCNGMDMKLKMPPFKIDGKKTVLDGAVAAWYFDGKEMHEDFLLDCCDITVEDGKLSDSKGLSFFKKTKSGFSVDLKSRQGQKISFALSGSGESSHPLFKQKSYANAFNYRILKMNRMNLKAILEKGGKKEGCKGTAYFQKVTVNAPAVPWFWSIVHFKDGSWLSYFNPHFGTSAIRKKLPLRFLDLPLKKELEFYDAKTKKHHSFKKLKISRTRDSLPMWRICAGNGSESISVSLESYSKALWLFRKKVSLLPFKSSLHYNEYCVSVPFLELRNKDGKVLRREKELGKGTGNAEHTWGFLW